MGRGHRRDLDRHHGEGWGRCQGQSRDPGRRRCLGHGGGRGRGQFLGKRQKGCHRPVAMGLMGVLLCLLWITSYDPPSLQVWATVPDSGSAQVGV